MFLDLYLESYSYRVYLMDNKPNTELSGFSGKLLSLREFKWMPVSVLNLSKLWGAALLYLVTHFSTRWRSCLLSEISFYKFFRLWANHLFNFSGISNYLDFIGLLSNDRFVRPSLMLAVLLMVLVISLGLDSHPRLKVSILTLQKLKFLSHEKLYYYNC